MGAIEHLGDGTRRRMSAACSIGRGPGSELLLTDARVSTHHAVLRWSAGGWRLRDLGSSNGTAVDGRRLEPGADEVLRVGVVLVFGDPSERWRVVDVSPPGACARETSTGRVVFMEDDVLALPTASEPEALLFAADSGWVLETEDGARPALHGETVVAGGSWRLELAAPAATAAAVRTRDLAAATLRFSVSPDEEHVDLEFVWPDDACVVPPSVHLYLLLTLARERLRDEEDGGLAERERGWVDRDRLCSMLRIEPQKLNVDIFRLRNLLAKTGVAGTSALIERRSTTRQLRIATGSVEVRSGIRRDGGRHRVVQ